jgi:SSS family solute:Na+ symporter
MLTLYDYIVIASYFVFMTVIGWVFRRFVTNTSEYFRGGGRMVWWMAGSSAFMVAFSAWTFTGAASKAYEDGTIIMVIYLGNALGFLGNALYFAPRFRQMRVVTSMEGIRERFGRLNEQFFTWLQVPLGVLYAGIWLNGLAVFMAAVFGLDLTSTIIVVGSVVVIMSAVGGAWAVVASDFMQMLILIPITIVAAVLAVAHVGGWSSFWEQVPRHHFRWDEGARPTILYLWIGAMLIKQFVSTNNMLDASRYLNVKDSQHARKAAVLAAALMLLGPLVWFLPPMAASIVHPDLAAQFPKLANPSEAAYVAMCYATMPAGMIGLLVSGIFAATMSSMDSGLNRNAGFLVRNFYVVAIRPRAAESELLLVGKLATLLLGGLVILAALTFSSWKNVGLFDLMLRFGSLVALPYTVPLIWGIVVKRAPSWAGWSTVLVGFATSLLGNRYLTPAWVQQILGWSEPLTRREQGDWVLLLGVLLNFTVCTAWFFASCLFARWRSAQERERVESFFRRVATPVDFAREEGAESDALQGRVLGRLCLAYGAFVALLTLIPNPLKGRLSILFCAACLLGIGALLRRAARRSARRVAAAGLVATPQSTANPNP